VKSVDLEDVAMDMHASILGNAVGRNYALNYSCDGNNCDKRDCRDCEPDLHSSDDNMIFCEICRLKICIDCCVARCKNDDGCYRCLDATARIIGPKLLRERENMFQEIEQMSQDCQNLRQEIFELRTKKYLS